MATLESIETILESFGRKFDAVDKRFDAMDRKFDFVDKKFDHMLDLFSRKFDSLEKKFDEKIDDLAAMTARGFLEMNRRFGNVEDRLEVIEENYVTKADLASFIQSRTLP